MSFLHVSTGGDHVAETAKRVAAKRKKVGTGSSQSWERVRPTSNPPREVDIAVVDAQGSQLDPSLAPLV